MKVATFLKQPILQIIFYILLYEIILKVLKKMDFIRMNISIGISTKYLFYLYLILSLFLSITILISKKNKFAYSISFLILFISIIISLFGIKTLLIDLIMIISIISVIGSFYIVNIFEKKKISDTI